ncbi:MAG: hypothetical protein KKD75_05500 [Nanoarchaeota archaeon]|nr:hypothetical protein [Nanoarchaeota archaeon]
MAQKKKVTQEEELLEYQYQEIINYSKNDFGDKKISFMSLVKRGAHDRINTLKSVINDNWLFLIKENIIELITRIESRKDKVEDFSNIIWGLNSIKEKINLNEYKTNELKEIYVRDLGKIKTEIKSKIDLEKYKKSEKRKSLFLNIVIGVLIGAVFFLLGYFLK